MERNLKNRSKNISVGCIYRYPHYNNIDGFTNYMNDYLSKLNNEKKEFYIAGDFNIHLLKYDTNGKYCDYYNITTSHCIVLYLFI